MKKRRTLRSAKKTSHAGAAIVGVGAAGVLGVFAWLAWRWWTRSKVTVLPHEKVTSQGELVPVSTQQESEARALATPCVPLIPGQRGPVCPTAILNDSPKGDMTAVYDPGTGQLLGIVDPSSWDDTGYTAVAVSLSRWPGIAATMPIS